MPPGTIALLLIAPIALRAQQSFQPSLLDYVQTAWTQHDGIPMGAVQYITQTTDGYLWIATTEEGLLRFDGVRFVPVASPCGHTAAVEKALSDRSGGLWLLCDYRLFHRDASGRTEPVTQTLLPPELRPSMEMYVDRRGRLWLWGRSLGYLQPDGSEGPRIEGTERLPNNMFCSFAEDAEGNLWFSANGNLLRVRDNRAEPIAAGEFTALAPARSGGIYALSQKGLFEIHDRSVATVIAFGGDILPTLADCLAETEHGIWFGTRNHGVALLRRGRIETFDRQQGLSSESITRLYVDREHTVWVGTPLGLHRFREPLTYLMSASDGVPPGMPQFVYRDSRNGLWISANWTVRIDAKLGKQQVFDRTFRCIAEDRSGRIWLASATEVGYLSGERFVPVRDAAGAPVGGVHAMHLDEQGELWALASASGVYRLAGGVAARTLAIPEAGYDFLVSSRFGLLVGLARGAGVLQSLNGRLQAFGPEPPKARSLMMTLYEDRGEIWIGEERGLSRWRNGKWTTWTSGHGLPGRGWVFEIIADAEGRIWLMSDGGILVIRRQQLDETPDGQPRRLTFLRIGTLDRVTPHRGGITSSPRVTIDPEGRLYFATVDSIAVVDPKRLNEQAFIPPIIVETVFVDRRPVDPAAAAGFIKPEEVQFEYTSLSLRNPENVRFRYRLEGHDPDWIEAGTQRRAAYGWLKPGPYRFRVIGSGSEGVWNETGASYAFLIAAPFYETTPFLLAAAVLPGGAVWTMHRYRLRLAADRVRLRMEAQSAERLRIAQDMHDSFLQGIQGSAWMIALALQRLDDQVPEVRGLLDRAQQMVTLATQEAREMLSSLRNGSPPREGLISRLKSAAAREAALYRDPPRLTVECSGTARELHGPVDQDVFLIACEALKNALRHANARHIGVMLCFGTDGFRLSIVDDGRGIDPEIQVSGRPGHFGLQGMRERATRSGGILTIESRCDGGTEMHLAIGSAAYYRRGSLVPPRGNDGSR